VCVYYVIGGLAVWRHNKTKKNRNFRNKQTNLTRANIHCVTQLVINSGSCGSVRREEKRIGIARDVVKVGLSISQTNTADSQ